MDFDRIDLDLELSQDIILKDILHKFTLINWDVNCHFEYYINNYKLSDNIEFNIITKFFINRILLIVEFNTKDLLIDNFFLNDENKHDKIKEYIKFIYDIKNNYSYSKILDCLILKDKQDSEESIMIAKMFIAHNTITNCCVCMEKNIVMTKCMHNLCRTCDSEILKKAKLYNGPYVKCPMCRTEFVHTTLIEEDGFRTESMIIDNED